MMDEIRKEVQIDCDQYGGIKHCGAEHFLIQAWDNILTTLEDNRSTTNLITIDYAKVFNRMSHHHCLHSFRRKGASENTLRMIRSFLTGRTMQVKVGQQLSSRKRINGGSPQGSVLANALFCATLEGMQDGDLENNNGQNNCAQVFNDSNGGVSLRLDDTILVDLPSTQNGEEQYCVPFEQNRSESSLEENDFLPAECSSPKHGYPTALATSLSPIATEIQQDEDQPEVRPLSARRLLRRIWDSEGEITELLDQECLDEEMSLPRTWAAEPLWFLKYIDDGLGGEKLCNNTAITHITTRKQTKTLHAIKSENFLKLTAQNAHKIGMQINENKTKMLSINVARDSDIRTYINTSEMKKITSGDQMKILGFVFGRTPNAHEHLKYIRAKFYSKLWIIRHMSSAGATEELLVKIYCSYIRPVLEYVSVVYNALITEEESDNLEDLQRAAFALIYGRKISYKKAIRKTDTKTLYER